MGGGGDGLGGGGFGEGGGGEGGGGFAIGGGGDGFGGGGDGLGGGGESATGAAPALSVQSGVTSTRPYPPAWPAQPFTVPLEGMVTVTVRVLRWRLPPHCPPEMLAPPDTSVTYWPLPLLSVSVSISPGTYVAPHEMVDPPRFHATERPDEPTVRDMMVAPTRRERLQPRLLA